MPAARRKPSVVATYMTRPPTEGEKRGFDLPDDLLPEKANGERVQWHKATVRWWETWRVSPQSAAFMDTDWDFLLDTALAHHTMWDKGRFEFMNEVRMRTAKFGATPKDRFDLRMEQDPKSARREAALPDKDKRGNVTSITERRARSSLED